MHTSMIVDTAHLHGCPLMQLTYYFNGNAFLLHAISGDTSACVQSVVKEVRHTTEDKIHVG